MRGEKAHQTDLHRLKERIDTQAVAREYLGIELNPRGWGRCPYPERHHNGDANPSFQLSRGIFKCWSQGCFGEQGVDIFGLVADLRGVGLAEAIDLVANAHRPSEPDRTPSSHSRCDTQTGIGDGSAPSTAFEYRNVVGDLVYTIKRTESLDGKQFRCVPSGIAPEARLLYRLPELVDGDDPVVIAEGEGCVEHLRALGYTATCNPLGAGKWRPHYNEALQDRHVVVWPDNDPAGARHGEAVAHSLAESAASVRMVSIPAWMPDCGDVVDALELRREAAVRQLIENAALWSPSAHNALDDPSGNNLLRAGLVQASTVDAKEVEWTWYPYIPRGFITMLYGDGDVRKSWLAMAIAAGITRGGRISPFDEGERPSARVLYFSGEDDVEHSLAPKSKGTRAYCSRLYFHYGAFDWDAGYLAHVEELVREHGAELVVFDPVVSFQADVRSNEANQVRAGLARIAALAARQQCSVLLVHHVGKDRARGVDQLHLGSVDYRNAARSTLLVALTEPGDETKPSVVVHRKHNVSPRRGKSIEFTTEEPWQFRWVGVSELDPEALYPVGRQTRSQRQAGDEVGDFLKEVLRDGPMAVADVFAAAAETGFTKAQVRTARERVCRKPQRRGGVGCDGWWEWELKERDD